MNKLFILTHLCALLAVYAHYDMPPCDADDMAVEIPGVPGVFCSPQCGMDDSCPTDVPPEVTAIPQCVLEAPTGESYCALVCIPCTAGTIGCDDPLHSECGDEMTCEAVPQSDGFGICTYPEPVEGNTVHSGLDVTSVTHKDAIDLDLIAATK